MLGRGLPGRVSRAGPFPVFERSSTAVSGSDWSYVIVFLVAAIDAFFPVVPSEATAIAAGVVAGAGDLNVLVLIAASLGAIVGDNISFALGHFLGDRVVNRFFKGEKSQERLAWAQRTLDARGGYLIVVARFIPGGRTVTTFTAGFVETYPWRRFLLFDVIAGIIWGTYTVLLGYLGGKTFEEDPWKGLLLGFGIALAVTAAVEAVRHLRLAGLPRLSPRSRMPRCATNVQATSTTSANSPCRPCDPAAGRILVGRERKICTVPRTKKPNSVGRSISTAAATRRTPSGRRAARSRG